LNTSIEQYFVCERGLCCLLSTNPFEYALQLKNIFIGHSAQVNKNFAQEKAVCIGLTTVCGYTWLFNDLFATLNWRIFSALKYKENIIGTAYYHKVQIFHWNWARKVAGSRFMRDCYREAIDGWMVRYPHKICGSCEDISIKKFAFCAGWLDLMKFSW
jgi:hypothetical protein